MIYTSYYANWRKVNKFIESNQAENFKTVSISRYPPKWAKYNLWAQELSPSKELLQEYQEELCDDEEFERKFLTELNKLDLSSIIKKYDNSILLCYEKEPNECHRSIVLSWLYPKKEVKHEI